MRKVLAIIVALAIPGMALAVPPGVSAQGAWVRYLLPNVPAGAYMTLQNNGDAPAVVTFAASPACGAMELHQSMVMNGTSMMMKVPDLTIPAHGSLVLAEGGYHLMCMGPKMKVGDKVPVTLSFEDGSTLDLMVPVYGAGGPQ